MRRSTIRTTVNNMHSPTKCSVSQVGHTHVCPETNSPIVLAVPGAASSVAVAAAAEAAFSRKASPGTSRASTRLVGTLP